MPKFRNRKTGEVVEARDINEARSLFGSSKKLSSFNPEKNLRTRITDRLLGEKASKILNTPLLPKFDTGSAIGNFIYDDLIRDATSIGGAAETYFGGKAIGAVGKGIWKVFGKGIKLPSLVEEAASKLPQNINKEKKIKQAADALTKAAQMAGSDAAVKGNLGGASAAMKAAKLSAAASKRLAQQKTNPANFSVPKRIIDKIGQLNNEFKGLYLSSGIPGTNINIHGLSLAARHALSTPLKEGGFIKGGFEVLPMLLSQKAAKKKLAQFNPTQIQYALKSGALADPASFGIATKKHYLKKFPGVKQLTELQEELFEKPLFDEFAPALKLTKFFKEKNRLMEAGLKMPEASKAAGRISTDLFGGYKSLSRSPQLAAVARAVLLAPDFYKTHFKLMSGMFKGVINPKNPEYAVYRHFAKNLAAATTALDLLNLKMSGKHLWENDPGYELSLNTGTKGGKDGKKDVYISVFGGAVDLPRLTLTVVNDAIKTGNPLDEISKFIHNRLSPIGRPLIELWENKDWKGEPYYGQKPFPTRVRTKEGTFSIREKYPISHTGKKLGTHFAQIVQPGWSQGITGAITGRLTKEEAIARALELPVRFKTHYTGVKKLERKPSRPITPQERRRRQLLLEQYR